MCFEKFTDAGNGLTSFLQHGSERMPNMNHVENKVDSIQPERCLPVS